MNNFKGDLLADVTGPLLYASEIVGDAAAEIERLRAALLELAALGEQGMEPDYGRWVTFHDKAAEVARAALNHEQIGAEK